MIKKLAVLSIIGLLFSNCTNTKIKKYEGIYTFGHEIRIFQDKDSEINYWLYSDDEKVEILNNYMKDLVEKEEGNYSEVELEIEGIDEGKATNGFAESNDKKMKVIKYKIIKK
ncbi:hypothetical protein [Fusobacterium sp. FSA-380-WT-3A]|uniref:hypothetical protein n=2 Tax=Fusobacterium TaxID=848 RepID=UPI0014770F71|nr:hypothetical protein [Fusobacterium sp. FSA-380-WT-3A]NME35371.1 hypothetical protein [Fusobacterium sp. FSA-380-WT-3A]